MNRLLTLVPRALIAGLLLWPMIVKATSFLYQMDTDRTEIPITIREKLMLVPAEVNGRSGMFLLDTGASRLFLNARIFESRNQPFVKEVTDVNGVRQKVGDFFVKDFHWGSLQRRKFLAETVNLETAEGVLGVEILGLIGYEVLQQVELHVDYGKQRIILYRLDKKGEPVRAVADSADHRIPFYLCRYLPVIQGRFGDEGKLMRLGLDSGASLNMLHNTWQKELEAAALRRHQISYHGVLSRKRVDYYTLPSLHIGGELALIHSKVAFVDLKIIRQNLLFIDGLLSVNLFRLGVVSVNYQRKEIRIWVRDNVFALKYRDLVLSQG